MKKIAPIAVAAVSLAGTGVGLRALSNYMANKSEYVKPQKGLKLTKELKMIARQLLYCRLYTLNEQMIYG